MKILIVEDEFDKREKICSFLNSQYIGSVEIVECESLRSGLRAVTVSKDVDFILLDMSMPGFDITDDEPGGGEPESYAGKELMAQMRLRNIKIPVIVITQYKNFDKGAKSLEDLTAEFSLAFPEIFIGAVYFNSAIEGWQRELLFYLNKGGVK